MKKLLYCSPYWLHQFTFLPTVWKCSLFSTPSLAFIICRLFNDDYSDQYEVILHCSFDLHFLIISNVEHFFMCRWPSICLLWRNVYLDLLPIFWFFFFLVYMLSCISCWHILEINPLSIASFANIVSHSVGCHLSCLWFPALCKSF